MTIEITEELLSVIGEQDITHPDQTRLILAELIEIIERDYIVQRRCPDTLTPDIRCDLPLFKGDVAAHGGDHETRLPGGNVVSWT